MPFKPELTYPRIMQEAAQLANAPAPQSLYGAYESAPKERIALATGKSQLQREVFGFVNAGNLTSPTVGWTTWNLGLLSTVAYFGLQVNSGDGNLVTYNTGWTVYHSQAMLDFVNAAHAAGTKVIVSINLHDMSTSPTNQVCSGLIAANAQRTIDQSVFQITAAGIDGININYEATNTTCANGLTSRAQMTDFTRKMRAAMPAGKYLAIDTYTGSAEDNLEFFDITGLAPYVDSFFVMAYDMDYDNAVSPPLSCASYCFNPTSPLNTYRFNTTLAAQQYTKLVPASKVILGQPYYGSRGCGAQLNDAHQIETRDHANPTYQYAGTVSTQTGVAAFTAHRDPSEGVAEWDTWYDSDWVCNREQYFDDTVSLAAKYDLVNFSDLRGVGLFALDYAGGAPELWNLLAAKFTTVTQWTSLNGIFTSGPGVSSWDANRVDVFARAQDTAMWQNTWTGTSWSTWAPLGGIVTGDPGAASWGAGRIDVFVRGQDNALWHRHWYGTGWAGWEYLGGGLNAGPAVASWAAQRLDIFITGYDNQLWHKYWNNGWSGWEALGGTLTSSPSTVSWGLNRIDIFARGADNGIWHMYWGNGWSRWEPLGGQFVSAPAAASCTAGHLDVFAVGLDHGLWRKSWTGNQWTPWVPQGGRWTSDPGATCVTGTTRLDVLATGIDSAMWQTTMTAA
ncbi:MAG: hypothetical protein NVS9B11_22420 [Candidatus Dormibacteraceae bacterium]